MSAMIILGAVADCPQDWQLAFQDSASPVSEEIVFFHDSVMFILTIIMVSVLWLIVRSLVNSYYYKYLVEGTTIEVVWTLMPAVILMFIAFPSLSLLYLMDEIMEPALTIKAIGHQWYWSYEYSDYAQDSLEFDSYMVPTDDLEMGDFSLLEVDNSLVVPSHTHVSVLMTGADVLHSFAVPSLGMKMDAVPGSLNQTGFFTKSSGVFYGQCSEICGANHSFMPMVVEAVSLDRYLQWLSSKFDE